MLNNISPILTPDLFRALYEMGHGDTVAIVDGWYRAITDCQADTKGKVLVRLPGFKVADVAKTVLDVLPLETATRAAHLICEDPLMHPDRQRAITRRLEQMILNASKNSPNSPIGKLNLDNFHAHVVREARVVVWVESDKTHWACLTLLKGAGAQK